MSVVIEINPRLNYSRPLQIARAAPGADVQGLVARENEILILDGHVSLLVDVTGIGSHLADPNVSSCDVTYLHKHFEIFLKLFFCGDRETVGAQVVPLELDGWVQLNEVLVGFGLVFGEHNVSIAASCLSNRTKIILETVGNAFISGRAERSWGLVRA